MCIASCHLPFSKITTKGKKYVKHRELTLLTNLLKLSCASIALPCVDPGTPIGGSKSSTNYNAGSTIIFTCSAGFTLRGSSSRKCQDGVWTGTQATCVGK